jgi:hypothetical protein
MLIRSARAVEQNLTLSAPYLAVCVWKINGETDEPRDEQATNACVCVIMRMGHLRVVGRPATQISDVETTISLVIAPVWRRTMWARGVELG